ncbi:putative ATPase/DNA-binding winged helix-turn-helix (wHTH) protein [Caballeronia udeis]|uniref:ATPase/DNA-binding winged helix-turn-helix (WHTH) protein n=1 Tax=Caballeronia udeis TaxID=1232866 RepID=A0ABW8MFJ8_9BURK
MVRIGQLLISLESREIQLNSESLRIGSRAFDILEVLIRAEGTLVSKDEIMRRVWPDTVVEENNLQVHVAALRKALGADRDLIKTVPGRGYRLIPVHEDSPLQHEDVASLLLPCTSSMLPAGVSALIGRQTVVAQVLDALSAARVLTLVGAGGIGKTRVALEVAGQAAARFPDGVVFVPLASVSNARFALEALAGALGMKLPAGRLSPDLIGAEIAGRCMLIVLDNCEHVIDAAAEIARAMTAANPESVVLATSREALRIQDEVLYHVPSLDVPADASLGGEILQTSAVQLFLARARTIDPRFSSDEHSLFLTGLVCRRLDGIPLAIELAAARAAVLGIEVLADHLDERFRILTGGFRGVLPRHQTLKAMLDWSYRLLDDTERTLLRWLGVFLNGFSFDAASHMVAARGFSQTEILDALSGLVSKSLVIHDNAAVPSRYRLLATTRAYALQQLEDNGERKAAALAHANWLRTVFARDPYHRTERPPRESLAQFRHEVGNLRTALDWAFGSGGDRTLGIELSAMAVPFLFDVSLVDECCERARTAIDAASHTDTASVSASTKLRLLAAYAAGLVYTQGPTAAVRDVWSEVLSLAVVTSDTEFESRALWGLWNAYQYGGEARAALLLARRFSALAQQLGNRTQRVIGRRIEGIALHYAGEPSAAREQLEGMLNAYVHDEHRWNAVGFRIDHGIAARATLARVSWVQGETQEASRLAHHALDAALEYEHDMVTCYVLVEALIPIALLMQDTAVAGRGIAMLRTRASQAGFAIWATCCDCYEEYLQSMSDKGQWRLPQFRASLDALRESGFIAPLTLLLAQFARASLACGRRDDATTAINEAFRHCEETGERWYYPELCRVRGEISLAGHQAMDAKSWFVSALDHARRQGAIELERRAAASLGELQKENAETGDMQLSHALHDGHAPERSHRIAAPAYILPPLHIPHTSPSDCDLATRPRASGSIL